MPYGIITFFYLLPSIFLSALGVVVLVHLPKFHSTTLGVSLGIISFAIFSSRIWDAVTDPIIGYLSDRVSAPFLRRPIWVVVGGLGTAATFLWLTNSTLMAWWGEGLISYAALFLLFFLAYTAVLIPYESWALELQLSERLRTRLILLREGGALFGTLVAGALPVYLVHRAGPAENAFYLLGWILSGALLLSLVGVVLFVPWPTAHYGGAAGDRNERMSGAAYSAPAPRVISLYQNFFSVLRTPGFCELLLAFSLTTIAAQIPAALILFFVEYVLRLTNPYLYILLYFVGAVLAFPFWLWAVKYREKAELWFFGLLVNTGAFFFVLFLPRGSEFAFGAASLFSGLGLGGVVAIPTALGADIVEQEQRRSGVRREGSFVGVWNIVRKLSAALGVAGVLSALSQLGFQPEQGQAEVPAHIEWWLTFFYCGLPCLLNAAAMAVVYSFYRKSHKDRGYHEL